MKINVYNKKQVEELQPEPESVLISISCPGKPVNLKEGWKRILRLEFDDIVSIEEALIDKLQPFTNEQRDQVIDFINENKNRNFVIHCDAGISRSVAIGIFIQNKFNGELILHAPTATTTFANSLVLRKLRRKEWDVKD